MINDRLCDMTPMHKLQFMLSSINGANYEQAFSRLMKSGLDDNSLGFWVWDIESNVEMYSPKFRESLQYEGEHDFPSTPLSWQSTMFTCDAVLANSNFSKHVESKGEYEYLQRVRYHKKYDGVLDVLCYGVVVQWDGDDPLVVIGVHMPLSGMYQSTLDKFGDELDIDVSYKDILNLPTGKCVELSKGVTLKLLSKNDGSWDGVCKMSTLSELAKHHHSDFNETFKVKSGAIKDLISGIILKKGDAHTFKRGKTHLMLCLSESTIEIKGIYDPFFVNFTE